MMHLPTTYQGWLARIYSVNTPEEIVSAAQQLNSLMPDKNRVRADVAVALAKKYKADRKRADDNQILVNTINRKYETLTKALLGISTSQVVALADSVEQG